MNQNKIFHQILVKKIKKSINLKMESNVLKLKKMRKLMDVRDKRDRRDRGKT